jgi:hypothetical protein
MKTIATKSKPVFRTTHDVTRRLQGILWIGLLTGIAGAQDLPEAPAKHATPPAIPTAASSFMRGGLTCGGGATTSSVATKPTAQCGALLGLGFLDIEAGVIGPQADRSNLSGYLSTNLWFPLNYKSTRGIPVAVGGYTRMFETGHALDYGLAWHRPVDNGHSIQFEVRDYWAFANPNQHNVVFRVVWMLTDPTFD